MEVSLHHQRQKEKQRILLQLNTATAMNYSEFENLKDKDNSFYSIWRNGKLIWKGMEWWEVRNYRDNTDSNFTIYREY